MSIIYIFGPSCSGKSTLCIELKKILGTEWIHIDRDNLIEQKNRIEVMDNIQIADLIHDILESTTKEIIADVALDEIFIDTDALVIIESQIPSRNKKDGEFYFLLLPPLDVLLQRNTMRDERRNRNYLSALTCRQFVTDTFAKLNKIPKEQFDAIFDSSSMTISDIANEIALVAQNKDTRQRIVKKF